MIKDVVFINKPINTIFKFTMLAARVIPKRVNSTWVSFETKNRNMYHVLLSESPERASMVVMQKNFDNRETLKRYLKDPVKWDLSEVKMIERLPDYENGTIRPLFAYYDPRIPGSMKMVKIALRNSALIKRLTHGEIHGDIITNDTMSTAMMLDEETGLYTYSELEVV